MMKTKLKQWLSYVLPSTRAQLHHAYAQLNHLQEKLDHLQAQFNQMHHLLAQSQHLQTHTQAMLQSYALDHQQYHLSHQQRLDQLENLLPLQSQVFVEPPPFAWQAPSPDWLDQATQRLSSQTVDDGAAVDCQRTFYSHYSEIGGDHRPILHQQYACYLPLIRQASAHGGRVLDIGCGAGEWLTYLTAHDIATLGIDQDAGEVVRARQTGLSVHEVDALGFLQTTEESFAAITLLQVIEHLPPDMIQTVLEHCLLRLRPGGLLMVETLNLRHPLALQGFYTDPTHQVPLSDTYLGFLLQWVGLQQLALLYTLPQPVAGLSRDEPSRLYQNYTLYGFKASH